MTVEEADVVIAKQQEQIVSLENQLRRLPSDASEVAEIQAAVYGIVTSEAEELQQMLELERRQFEEFRRAHELRQEKLLERRRELLKRGGVNIEDMTRRALMNRPEDPRMALLKDEFARYRESAEREKRQHEATIAEQSEQLRRLGQDAARNAANRQDLTQYVHEIEALKEQLAKREQDLTSLHHEIEEERKRMAFEQLAVQSAVGQTNQTREAQHVKLASWMSIGK